MRLLAVDEGSYAIPPHYRLEDEGDDSDSLNEYSHYERLLEIRNQQGTLDGKFPDVYTTTDGSSSKEQQDALQALQSSFASLLTDLDSMWNKGSDANFWDDMFKLLPAAESCWKAGVVPKWSFDMSNSPSGRLWVIQQNGVWTRWAPEYSRWDIYSETRLQIAADPSTPSACYFINPDGSVHWRDVDGDVNKSFPGITAQAISVGGDNRLWAIQQNGVWTRWAPEYSRWDIYSETRLQIAADPSTPSACYFINPDGSVHWRDVDGDVNKSFPGITAQAISVGGQ
ncbi:MAG: hypothetical protein AB1589_35175 [Cyanobacteriota bacterium]